MPVVRPLVAADSESILRPLRFLGASRAASALSRDMSLAIGDSFGDNAAPPGFRHRRRAPELA